MKNKILLILLSLMLSMPIPVLAVDSIPYAEKNADAVENVIDTLDQNMQEEQSYTDDAVSNIYYKQPISKKKLVKKFFLAMLAVGLSSLILYFGLMLYNRLREGLPIQIKTKKSDSPLSAPSDLESASKIFLEKTKW